MRKYSCIHATARSEYCCKCSAEMRDEAIVAGTSAGSADSAEPCPAVPSSTANTPTKTTRLGSSPQSSFRQNPARQPKSPSMVDPKVPSPKPCRFTQFLYQVCENYPPGNGRRYPSVRTRGTMSLDIKHLARQSRRRVWHPTCNRKGRRRQV